MSAMLVWRLRQLLKILHHQVKQVKQTGQSQESDFHLSRVNQDQVTPKAKAHQLDLQTDAALPATFTR